MAIVHALGDLSSQTVVEIGPGAGAITEILVPRAARLIAIELDHDLASRLRAQFPAIQVLEADVLSVDFAALGQASEKLVVVGNLPYYITSPILLHLFHASSVLSTAVIMMQREVAERILAAPGSSDYGLLSATTQLYARADRILDLAPDAFMPPPKVHSAVVRLIFQPRFAELGVEPQTFLPFLRQSFAQKRKTLAKNLRAAGFEPASITNGLEAAGIPPTARAEEIHLERMASLLKALRPR
jgi:16S rRNA (adenine1518-N6/adenine1519-N6)-dimethyltransferase